MSTVPGQRAGSPVPEPGWYTDPHGSGDRWWDGQSWTEHTQAAPAPVATAWPAPPPAATWTPSYSGPLPGTFLPVVKNTQATVGLVISLVAIPIGLLTGIWFASLIGALVSSRGLRRAKVLETDGNGPVGRSMAIWGAALGIGFYALGLLLRILAH